LIEIIILSSLGFAGFEGLRIYKKLEGKENPIPSPKWVYFGTILWLMIFSGVVSWALGIDKRGVALYIGFSLPCSLKAFMKGRLTGEGIEVDDVEISKGKLTPDRSLLPKGYINWLHSYFRF
jgi:hypothetical protein